MTDQPRYLHLTGPINTATSAITALLNSSPSVFVLFEALIGQDPLNRRARDLLAVRPHALGAFSPAHSFEQSLDCLRAQFAAEGFTYHTMGLKHPSIDSRRLRERASVPTIYCLRDLRSWLVKPLVRRTYLTDVDVVPAAVGATVHLAESFLLPSVVHVSLEDFLADHVATVRRLEALLGVALNERYWQEIGRQPGPKSEVPWWRSHASTMQPPRPGHAEHDPALADHPFWDELLPTFGRYQAAARADSSVSEAQVAADCEQLRSMLDRWQVPLATAYEKLPVTPPKVDPLRTRLRRAGRQAKLAVRELRGSTVSDARHDQRLAP